VGFVVDKAVLGQVFSEYLGFPCQTFHQFLHHHKLPAGTIGHCLQQCRVDPIGLHPHYTNLKKIVKELPTFYSSREFISVLSRHYPEPENSSSQHPNLFPYIFVKATIIFVLSQLCPISIHMLNSYKIHEYVHPATQSIT
jgi:hypothetical protein